MKITSIKGFADILPEEVGAWQRVEAAARRIFDAYHFAEIRIPIVEKTDLFSRSIGETTDIVEKEMYTFEDRDSRSNEATDATKLTLRPEGTAGVVRAYVEAEMYKVEPVRKLYYMGPMFRRERPQKGRMRQFHQIGAEALGRSDPFIDAEILLLLNDFFGAVGLTELTLQINSLGDSECRPQYREKLLAFLKAREESLCANCRRRIDRNPLRALDCKEPGCIAATQDAPSILDSLCVNCREHFATVQRLLRETNVEYHAQSAHGARAGLLLPDDVRMDDHAIRLSKRGCRGRALRRVGRATRRTGDSGCRVCDGRRAADDVAQNARERGGERPEPLHRLGRREGARLGVSAGSSFAAKKLSAVEMEGEARSLKSQMRRADKFKASSVLIVGEDELAKGKAVLRDMASKRQDEISLDRIEAELTARKAS